MFVLQRCPLRELDLIVDPGNNRFSLKNSTNPYYVLLKARGDSAYERGGDARRKLWIKPLKETDLGVAQAFADP